MMEKKVIKKSLTQEKVVLLLQILILLLLSLFYIIFRVFPSLEMLFAFTILIFIWKSKQRALLKDLLPFFLLLLTYQSLRGFADNLSPAQIHITDLIGWEKSLFGGIIPAYAIQAILPSIPGHVVIAWIANLLYMSHFLNPVIVAIIIWYYKKDAYWAFIFGLLVLTYAAFFTYLFFPAAPPWWATKYGYLLDQPVTMTAFVYPSLVEFFGRNPVAAMPSLHMAYPSFIFFVSIYLWKRKAILIGLLPILVGISTLILGHHYVIDLIMGVIYAACALVFTISIHRYSKLWKISNQ